ncbi:MAG: 3-hydroxyacyl-CoA dehydrogenase [Deinococcus sp.]|uniref:3-hydroxyacyl-CoA dehydrogenase n=1 Tax=Deinococcus sp. TaxID=47478 RepID=UPI0026DBE134|nr:3-hydroxyacyl-CoA dehydrogenase [Deinococcus sp.]MDO4245006.1 3-hydroxyacyl-CoA dehydrogenase [Deinococcus sp.]
MTIKKVTVLGAGVLGAQIAFQAAYAGFDVVSYDINEEALGAARKRFDELERTYLQDVKGASEDKLKQARDRLSQSADLTEAVKAADLIIEAVPENIELKRKVWAQVGQAAPAQTIFTTNTSTLLPSSFADASGDPSRFLALHFANNIWVNRVVEVMGTAQTKPEVAQQVYEFAEAMKMKPFLLKKEQPGYIINSLLVPFLDAAAHLLGAEVASPKEIDSVWKLATGSPHGPFEIMDVVGLRTVYAIHSSHGDSQDADNQRFLEIVKNDYLDKGKTGKDSGSGFYDYDDSGAVKN